MLINTQHNQTQAGRSTDTTAENSTRDSHLTKIQSATPPSCVVIQVTEPNGKVREMRVPIESGKVTGIKLEPNTANSQLVICKNGDLIHASTKTIARLGHMYNTKVSGEWKDSQGDIDLSAHLTKREFEILTDEEGPHYTDLLKLNNIPRLLTFADYANNSNLTQAILSKLYNTALNLSVLNTNSDNFISTLKTLKNLELPSLDPKLAYRLLIMIAPHCNEEQLNRSFKSFDTDNPELPTFTKKSSVADQIKKKFNFIIKRGLQDETQSELLTALHLADPHRFYEHFFNIRIDNSEYSVLSDN